MLRWLPLLLLLAGCAAPVAAPEPPAAAIPRATIVAVRPVVPSGEVAAILGLSAPTVSRSAREFILRSAEGRILSVVQEDDVTLRPGRPVSVIGGDRAHLVGG